MSRHSRDFPRPSRSSFPHGNAAENNFQSDLNKAIHYASQLLRQTKYHSLASVEPPTRMRKEGYQQDDRQGHNSTPEKGLRHGKQLFLAARGPQAERPFIHNSLPESSSVHKVNKVQNSLSVWGPLHSNPVSRDPAVHVPLPERVVGRGRLTLRHKVAGRGAPNDKLTPKGKLPSWRGPGMFSDRDPVDSLSERGRYNSISNMKNTHMGIRQQMTTERLPEEEHVPAARYSYEHKDSSQGRVEYTRRNEIVEPPKPTSGFPTNRFQAPPFHGLHPSKSKEQQRPPDPYTETCDWPIEEMYGDIPDDHTSDAYNEHASYTAKPQYKHVDTRDRDRSVLHKPHGLKPNLQDLPGKVLHCLNVTAILETDHASVFPPMKTETAPVLNEKPKGCKTVYIGGLPALSSRQIIEEVFGGCGKIKKISLNESKASQHLKFCHLKFEDLSAVDKAVRYAGHYIVVGDPSAPIDAANVSKLIVDYAPDKFDQLEYNAEISKLTSLEDKKEDAGNFVSSKFDAILKSLHDIEKFTVGASVLASWCEQGACTKEHANKFYTAICAVNTQIKKLAALGKAYGSMVKEHQEKEKPKELSIIEKCEAFDKVFSSYKIQKVWACFTKAQRKTLQQYEDNFRKELKEIEKLLDLRAVTKQSFKIGKAATEKPVQAKNEDDMEIEADEESSKADIFVTIGQGETGLTLEEEKKQLLTQVAALKAVAEKHFDIEVQQERLRREHERYTVETNSALLEKDDQGKLFHEFRIELFYNERNMIKTGQQWTESPTEPSNACRLYETRNIVMGNERAFGAITPECLQYCRHCGLSGKIFRLEASLQSLYQYTCYGITGNWPDVTQEPYSNNPEEAVSDLLKLAEEQQRMVRIQAEEEEKKVSTEEMTEEVVGEPTKQDKEESMEEEASAVKSRKRERSVSDAPDQGSASKAKKEKQEETINTEQESKQEDSNNFVDISPKELNCIPVFALVLNTYRRGATTADLAHYCYSNGVSMTTEEIDTLLRKLPKLFMSEVSNETEVWFFIGLQTFR